MYISRAQPHFDVIASSEPTSDTIELSTSKSLDDDSFETHSPDKQQPHRSWCFSKYFKSTRYKGLKAAQIVCAAYIILMTFRYYPNGLLDPSAPLGQWRIIDVWNPENTAAGVLQLDGDPFGPKRAVVAKDRLSLICLAISRISAFTMYPCIFLVFMTKCKATINFFMTTPLSFYMVHDQHELHSFCGKFLAIDIWLHTFFHCLRWGLQGNIDLLWTNIAGITGLIALVACVLVCLPMMVQRLMKSIPYEVRKLMHIVFFYVFAVAMCFHNKTSAWPNGGYNQVVLGFCIVYYTLDAAYVTFVMTEMIETTIFNVLPSGVQMTLCVSENFHRSYTQGGYGYVCLPWVSKHQWHAFSLFEHPSNPNLRQIFMMNVGDWTKEVHQQLQRNTVRPVWLQGPFVSPYNNALAFDNTICVATGIGITPALSVIRAHRDSRRINLIWACRDVAMLEFFMDHLWLNNDGWILIYYTGKEELSPAIENAKLNSNIKLIKSRPDFEMIIPNIIFGIETGHGVPEAAVPSEKLQVRSLIAQKVWELEREGLSDVEIIEELTFLAHEKGFLLSSLVDERAQDKNKTLLQVIKDQFSIYNNVARSGNYIPPELSSTSQSYQGLHKRHQNNSSSKSKRFLRFNNSLAVQSRPWEKQPAAESFVLGLDKKQVLNTWGVLYCGGSKGVENQLRKLSNKYDLELHTETFAW